MYAVWFPNFRVKTTGKKPASSLASKKRKTTEKGSSSRTQQPVEFDKRKFKTEHKFKRFNEIRNWSFIKERYFDLQGVEFAWFRSAVDKYGWWKLVQPLKKFDPDIVREFYANALPEPLARRRPRTSFVRGKDIDYSVKAINAFLSIPYDSEDEETKDYYHQRLRGRGNMPFNLKEAELAICLEGRGASLNKERTKKTIFKKRNLTQRAQIWMTFLLHNILPKSHTGDVPIEPDGYLLFCMVTGEDIDIAQLLTDAIYKDVTGRSRSLAWPAFITGLCQSQGVRVDPTEPIDPTVDDKYVLRHCKEIVAAPPSPPMITRSPQEQMLMEIMEQNARILEGQRQIMEKQTLQGQQNFVLSQRLQYMQNTLYQYSLMKEPHTSLFMSPEDFEAAFPWPQEMPSSQVGGSSARPETVPRPPAPTDIPTATEPSETGPIPDPGPPTQADILEGMEIEEAEIAAAEEGRLDTAGKTQSSESDESDEETASESESETASESDEED